MDIVFIKNSSKEKPDEPNAHDENLKHIAKEYQDKSKSTSQICRVVVFGLIGAIWVYFQKDGIFHFNATSTCGLLLLSGYPLLDVIQYFVTAILYAVSFFYYDHLKKPDNVIDNIDKISLSIFFVKVVYLIITICIFINYIYLDLNPSGQPAN